jgi:hypothetical protein
MLDELKTVLQYSFLPAQIYCKGQFTKTLIYSISNCKIQNVCVCVCACARAGVCVCVCVYNNKFSYLLVINLHYTKRD